MVLRPGQLPGLSDFISRGRAVRSARLWFLPLVVLGVALGITARVFRSAEAASARELAAAFDFRVREVAGNIQKRMEAYRQVLRGAGGLFAASVSVERNEFRDYVSNLRIEDHYPGILGVGFAVLVPAADREKHVAAVRREGFSDYDIWPPEPRDPCTSIVYLEPFTDRNLRAFGFDMYSQPVRRAAMERSRDLGQVTISGKVILVQETEEDVQAGFVMYAPVYRNRTPRETLADRRAALVGWAFAPFRMDDLMAGILGERTGDVAIDVYDGAEAGPDVLMTGVSSRRRPGAAESRFRTERQLDILGHPWTLVVRSLAAFDARVDEGRPRLILETGIALSVLLALLSFVLLRSRLLALEAAREVGERETRYRQMFDGNASIAFIVDPGSGRLVDANTSASAFWGYPVEELRRMSLADFTEAPREALLDALRGARDGTAPRFEFRHRLRGQETRNVEVYGGPLEYEGKTLLYSVLHDITARKRSEEELLAARTQLEVANAKLQVANAELEELASHDKLTGAWNRRQFEASVVQEIERTKRSARPLSLILFDIDHFKEVNDRAGHQVGDRVLEQLSLLVRGAIRSVDTLTRWGGEEFIVVAPYSSVGDAAFLAEKLRGVIEASEFQDAGRVTVSFGVAEYLANESLDDWIGRADKALYAAKAAGRNAVRTWPEG